MNTIYAEAEVHQQFHKSHDRMLHSSNSQRRGFARLTNTNRNAGCSNCGYKNHEFNDCFRQGGGNYNPFRSLNRDRGHRDQPDPVKRSQVVRIADTENNTVQKPEQNQNETQANDNTGTSRYKFAYVVSNINPIIKTNDDIIADSGVTSHIFLNKR